MIAPARTRWFWLAAALLMLAEFLVFDRMTSRYHACYYPRWTDEIQYLREAYTAGLETQAHGLWAGLKFTLVKPAVQGTLHDFFAVLVFWLVGSPSRSAALSLNMLVFLAWQAALFAGILRVSGSRTVAWMAFGLVLCVAWPWSVEAGSAVDFRLDHGAMCLMGIAAITALLTDGFRSTRWSLVFGAAAAITMLERFLTGVYFTVIFAVSTLWILGGPARGLRLRNLLLAGLTVTLLAGPMYWLNRTTIYDYYWIGHMASAAADAIDPGLNRWQSIQFIFGYLSQQQLGAWFCWTAAAGTILLGLPAANTPRSDPPPPANRDWLFFGLVFFLGPATVLCLHRQKSFYVLGTLVPGVILLICWLWTMLWRRIDFTHPEVRALPAILTLFALITGGGFFLQQQLTPPHTEQFKAGAAKVNQVVDYLFTTSRKAGLTQPRFGTDLLTDYFDARAVTVLCYERHHQWMTFDLMLPPGILEEKDEFIMTRLGQCDFVILTDVFPENGYYPFDRQMRRLYPVVKEWCEGHLRHVESFPLFNRQMSLYQRRDIP